MKIETLEKQAGRARRRAQKVRDWRLKDTWPGFAAYLFYRNRFPVLNKLCARGALLLEIYLLYLFFHSRVVTSLSLVLFGFYIISGLYSGVTQVFRLAIVKCEQQGQSRQINELFFALLWLSALVGVVVAGAATGLASLYAVQALSVAFIAVWIVVFPLDLLNSAYWITTYTQQRLRRSFWFVVSCRLLPSAAILLLHGPMGPYAYVLGVLLGRSLEYSYLIMIARRQLSEIGIMPERPRRLGSFIAKVAAEPGAWAHAWFPAPFQLYSLGLAFALAMRGSAYWLLYFVFFYLVASFAYVNMRAAQSMGMDIFLSLKNADLALAERFKIKVEKALLVLLSIMLGLLMLFFVINTAWFTLGRGVLYALWIYFLGEVAARSLIQSEIAMYRAAGSEHYFNRIFTWGFLGVMLPLQLAAILYFRANLPMVFLLDIVGLLVLGLALLKAANFEMSPVYTEALRREIGGEHLLPPTLWLKYLRAWRGTGLPYSLLVVQLDARYNSPAMREAFLRDLALTFNPSDLGCQAASGVMIYLLPLAERAEGQRRARRLLQSHGGHVRSSVLIDPEQSWEANLETILTALGKARESRREYRSLQRRLGAMLADGSLRQFRTYALQLGRQISSEGGLCEVVEKVLREHGLDKLPCIYFDGVRRRSYGRITPDLLVFANSVFSQYQSMRMIYPPIEPKFAAFAAFGMPAAVVDTSSLPGEEVVLVQLLVLKVNLVFSIELAAAGVEAGNVPNLLFELLHRKLDQVLEGTDGGRRLTVSGRELKGEVCLMSARTELGRRGLYYSAG